jgi:CheY-like chemotaxis protein
LLLACQDDAIRRILLPLFETLGTISVQEAKDGTQLDQLLSQQGPYNLVISQAALSGSRGLEALTKARERGDETPFILIQSMHQNFVRITIGGGHHSIVSTRLVNLVALLDLAKQFLFG